MNSKALTSLYNSLQSTTKSILKNIQSNKTISKKNIINLNGLKQDINLNAPERTPDNISKEMLQTLSKYARSSKRSAKSIVFALRRNKKYLFGDFKAPKKYIDYMHGLELYCKYQPKVENSNSNLKFNQSKLNKGLNLLKKAKLNENKYYGNRNTILANEILCPINVGRYVNASNLELQNKLIKNYETISLYHPMIEKEARYGKITYQTKAGKTETVEFAFDNLVAYELIKRSVIAQLNPNEIKKISIDETIKTARKTKQNCAEALTEKEIESLITSSQKLTRIYFNENQPIEKVEVEKVEENEFKFDNNQKPFQLRVISSEEAISKEKQNHALSTPVIPASSTAIQGEDLSLQ